MRTGNKTLAELCSPISAQLGRYTAPDTPTPREDAPRPKRYTDGLSHDELVDRFVSEAEKVRVSVHRCAPAEVASTIRGIIAKGESESAACIMGADEALAELHIQEALDEVTLWDPAQTDASIEAANKAGYGITFASAGIAETGTVMQVVRANCGRAVSLLPLVHIAVLDASSIVPTMRSCLAALHGEGGKHSRMPSQVCFISGPSATSDIELVRVEGVHGPMYVHYVVVDDGSAA
ncbi:MAG: LutC/YkgG family protein [Coriobacteriales bacterium]|jgi:L-lactate dehydrogenase complex protein LldG